MAMVEQHWAKGRNTPWMGKRVQFIVASQHICMALDGGIKPENTEVIIRNFLSLIFYRKLFKQLHLEVCSGPVGKTIKLTIIHYNY